MSICDCGFFVLRTPLLPFDEALLWSADLKCAELYRQGADSNALEKAWHSDIANLRAYLQELLQRPAVIQALAIASPSLERALGIWTSDPESKKGIQAERAIVRYFMRMTGRPTPFGLFSGCSVGSVQLGRPTEIVLASNEQYRSASRLDFDYLFGLASAFRHDASFEPEMRYSCNSSLHRIANSWHYIESRFSESSRSHHLAKLICDEHLDNVLSFAQTEPRSFAELAAVIGLCSGCEAVEPGEIRDYLRELIRNDIIVPNILPVLTGKSSLDSMLEELQKLPSAAAAYKTLEDIKIFLAELDRCPLGLRSDALNFVVEKLEKLPAQVDETRVLQVDMFKKVQTATIGSEVLEEISGALEILARFAVPAESRDLINFRTAFVERYEKRWVSLNEALDVELGIAYGAQSTVNDSPLLQELPRAGNNKADISNNLDEFQSMLLQKLVDAAKVGKDEIELYPEDLPPRKDIDDLLPKSFSVMISLAAKSPAALQQGHFELLLKGGLGPSSARTLGRFCSAAPDLEQLVRRALHEEEALDPDCVFAEIVHLPEGHTGNILCRPVLRDYEIPYLGLSGAPADKQLTTDDLLISVHDGRIVLHSKKLDCRVIPRLSSAHNYFSARLSPMYRFLCDLQNQGGVTVPNFGWGAADKLTALPRVRAGRVILSRAQWRISEEEIKSLCNISRLDAFLKVKELQKKRGFPRWVSLKEFDNLLPVDLDNPLSVDSLVHLLKRSPKATVIEMYPQYQNQSVTGPEGAYEHELIIPLINRVKASENRSDGVKADRNARLVRSSLNTPLNKRLLPPGSEWEFVKIYGGSSILEDQLISDIGPLMSDLFINDCIKGWYFVRYSDPDTHLRIRFQPLNATAHSKLSRALDLLLAVGTIRKLQFDTYHREIERYGGLEGLEASEQMFCADSDAVLTILRNLNDVEAADMRWKIALYGIEALLSDFGLEVCKKMHLMASLRKSFAHEFHLTSLDIEKLGRRFRNERIQLQSMLRRESSGGDSCFDTALRAFAHRSERNRPAVLCLRNLEKCDALGANLLDIIASHVHMNVNRIFQSSPRAHEVVLYDFLHRLYEGFQARANNVQREVNPMLSVTEDLS